MRGCTQAPGPVGRLLVLGRGLCAGNVLLPICVRDTGWCSWCWIGIRCAGLRAAPADGRILQARRILLEKIPFLLLGGTMLTTVSARLNPGGIWAGAQMDNSFNLFERVMQAFYVWGYYAWKPWMPFHLSPLYVTLVDFNPNTWPFWLSAALVIGATVLFVLRRKQWPWALALWASYLVLLVPVLGLTERPHYTVDRYDYLPGLVWAVVIAATLRMLSSRLGFRAVSLAFVVGLAGIWAGLSWHQTRVWRNSTCPLRAYDS